ncbi:MAG: PH domain-containing protein [Gammaproteobacteria bacterium]|nr:MAG: PH domain-containing protein [Gammaproteobacteria bacterium]
MSYMDRNLMPDEKILFRTKKHKIIFFYPLLLTLVLIFTYPHIQQNFILMKFSWVFILAVFIFWGYVWLEYVTSEFAVTNKRVMMREGFFVRHSNETRLSAIARVNVDQSLLGQLLNFGTVSINAFGAFDVFPLIASPLKFQKFVNVESDRQG